ncbi:MAG: T9SS type A sorting domain-containing protein, partial [Hymenobacteraceae bacterium]|nr:T9SS type A sorting domain-containing protein [Hymenobacteraceae bacterium]MDX5397351.1 T9SS type A sorting domain-containing protein [Hymenobacteraceae bacterium]MDX5513430.1 T9SS type A sorting domain-containing protein [Hymenobacteraceae bacterium]
ETAQITITDATGRVVYHQTQQLKAGNQKVEIRLDSKTATGIYTLTVTSGSQVRHLKLLQK